MSQKMAFSWHEADITTHLASRWASVPVNALQVRRRLPAGCCCWRQRRRWVLLLQHVHVSVQLRTRGQSNLAKVSSNQVEFDAIFGKLLGWRHVANESEILLRYNWQNLSQHSLPIAVRGSRTPSTIMCLRFPEPFNRFCTAQLLDRHVIQHAKGSSVEIGRMRAFDEA